jgi:hypothetical protein
VVSLGARARGGVAKRLGIRVEVGARRGWHPVRRRWLGATGPAWRGILAQGKRAARPSAQSA